MYVNAKCPNCGCMFGTNDAKLEFEKLYINAKELSEISGMTYNECLKVIEKCRSIMQEKRYYVPESRPKMALFRIVSEYLGLIDDSKTVKENVSKEEAEELKAKFVEVGATVELA